MAVAKIVLQTTILVGGDDHGAAVAAVKKHLPELRTLLSHGVEDNDGIVDCFEIKSAEALTGKDLDEEITMRDREIDYFDEYRDDVVEA